MVLDADAGNNKRKIIAFLGGLDLCDGRYDTPDHHLFRTLQTLHSDDYHNPTYAVILLVLSLLSFDILSLRSSFSVIS